MSHALQCRQFWALMCRRLRAQCCLGLPAAAADDDDDDDGDGDGDGDDGVTSSSTYSYTPAGQYLGLEFGGWVGVGCLGLGV